jgi:hypothetical protein
MSILEDVKSVVTTIQKIDNIELYRQILDLQQEVLQIVSANVELKAELATAREELRRKQTLRFEYNAYWTGETLETSDGPFCAKCWDTKQQLVRMLVADRNPRWSRLPRLRNLAEDTAARERFRQDA